MSLLDAILLEPYRDSKNVWIAFRTDGQKGSGTESDPWNGSTQNLFDGLMRGFNDQSLDFMNIHIGPGTFETKGNAPYDGNQGWEIRPGWKILGSGIDVTILKVVGAVDANRLIQAIGQKDFNTVAHYAEVSDLTVDCNLPVGPGAPNTAIAAVSLKGNHVRIRRVRAIHFGTYQFFPFGHPDHRPECFVLSVGGQAAVLPEPTDCIIEDCIVEHRAKLGGTNNITCLSNSSGEVPRTGIMEYHRGCIIRNCYVDGAFEDATVDLGQQVFGCSPDGGSGAIAKGNRISNVQVGMYHDTWSTRSVVMRHNHFKNIYRGAIRQKITGSSDEKLKYGSSLVLGQAGGKNIAILTTFEPHGLEAEDTVEISGAVAVDFTDNVERVSTLYNGSFEVLSNPAPTSNSFAYELKGQVPQHNAFGAFVFNKHEEEEKLFGFILVRDNPDPQVGFTYAKLTAKSPHGLSMSDKVDVTGAVMWDGSNYTTQNPFNVSEADIIEIIDDFTFKYDMGSFPTEEPFPGILFQKPGQPPAASGFGTPIVRNGDLMTFTTVYPHELLAGEGIKVDGVRADNETEGANYNGLFNIDSIGSGVGPTELSYRLKNPPAGLPDPAGAPTFEALWQVGQLVFEDNVVEIAARPMGTPTPPVPLGVFIEGDIERVDPYSYRTVIIRNNWIRRVAGNLNTDPIGIQIKNTEAAVVEGNVVDVPLNWMRHHYVGTIKYLNNRNGSEEVISGFDLNKNKAVEGLEDRVRDALTLSLM